MSPGRYAQRRGAVGRAGAGGEFDADVRAHRRLRGACGVPTTAKSLATNVTVVQPGAGGDVRLYPGDETVSPLSTTVSFNAGAVLANNVMMGLAHNGAGSVKVQVDSASSLNLLIDVNGYYQ